MNAARVILAMGLICAAGAYADAPVSPRDFAAYRVLQTRNIFDPDRRPIVTSAPPRPRPVEQPRKSNGYVMLTGIMVTDGKSLAFFSGSQEDYNKVIGVNADIAGAKVTKITSAGVEVDRGGKKINVPVGYTVPFDDSAPALPPAAASDIGSQAAASGGTSGPPGTPNPPSGNVDEIMRRMMERRQQQLK